MCVNVVCHPRSPAISSKFGWSSDATSTSDVPYATLLAVYVQWQTIRAPGELDAALASARRALALDENDSRCHRVLSAIYMHHRQYDRAEFHSDRSVALNPNDALAAIYRATLLRHLGRAEEGVDWARKAMRLNPYHPNWYWEVLAKVLHSAGCYAKALNTYGRIAERPLF
jgi:adenylate cyclase